MTTISNLLRASADRAAPVLAAIRDEQLGAPTPCAEYRVGDLINHLFQVVDNFEGLARKEPTDWSGTPDVLGADWRARFVTDTDALIAAWAPESALEGVSVNMGLPQLTIGRMVLLDLVLHPWDLAVATGQEFTPDADAVAELHTLADDLGDMPRKMGVFGEEVPVPADADPFTRLLGRAGRDPRWRAHAAARH